MTPESRKEQLLTQRVGDELVIYDERTHEAHRLNRTAAQVWEGADGARSVTDLARDLRTALVADGVEPIAPEDSEALVRLALDDLNQAGLLVKGLPKISEPMSRRQMLVVAAALVPVVASILAPTPAMAQSFFQSSSSALPSPPSPPLPPSSSSSSSSSTTGGNTGS
jgi:coenzyme PQQ synthesis protein D (PqqD)